MAMESPTAATTLFVGIGTPPPPLAGIRSCWPRLLATALPLADDDEGAGGAFGRTGDDLEERRRGERRRQVVVPALRHRQADRRPRVVVERLVGSAVGVAGREGERGNRPARRLPARDRGREDDAVAQHGFRTPLPCYGMYSAWML